MSIFSGNLFGGDLGALGELPAGARPLDALSFYRPGGGALQFNLPSNADLQSKGVTHFTVRATGPHTHEFSFFTTDGTRAVGPLSYDVRPASVAPDLTKENGAPVRREGDGLLPSPVSTPTAEPSSGPRWLPWALLGGGLAVGGGILFVATRRPKAVAANRRRRRRRRTSR